MLWEKVAEEAFRELDIFRRNFYEPNFLQLLITRKALTSLMETSVPRNQQQTSTKTCV